MKVVGQADRTQSTVPQVFNVRRLCSAIETPFECHSNDSLMLRPKAVSMNDHAAGKFDIK